MCNNSTDRLAAFNVGGLTIHRLFQLPIEHELGIGHFPRILRKNCKPHLDHLK